VQGWRCSGGGYGAHRDRLEGLIFIIWPSVFSSVTIMYGLGAEPRLLCSSHCGARETESEGDGRTEARGSDARHKQPSHACQVYGGRVRRQRRLPARPPARLEGARFTEETCMKSWCKTEPTDSPSLSGTPNHRDRRGRGSRACRHVVSYLLRSVLINMNALAPTITEKRAGLRWSISVLRQIRPPTPSSGDAINNKHARLNPPLEREGALS